MEQTQFVGYLVSAVITLGGFVAVIVKFIQPINELRIVIQKLNDKMDMYDKMNENHDKRIEKHGKEIDNLGHRVGRLETKMDMYHKEKV